MQGLAFALLVALAQAKTPDKELQGLAAKCGSEIPWVNSLTDAQKLSKSTGKPILWAVSRIEGSPMDRKLVLEKYMLSGPFMMPGVVEMVTEHFVPLRLEGEPPLHKAYGIAVGDFIEPGFIFLGPDLKVLHRVDRLTTFSEDWLLHLFRGVLKKAGREVAEKKIELSEGRRAIAEGRPDPSLFELKTDDESRWFHGVALHLVNRDGAARDEWKKIKTGRWAWKAAAELARDGPFVRGFEIYEALPPEAFKDELPTTSTLPRPKADVARAVRFLLQNQRNNGVWEDSHYNFGGDASLPNVYMAVTALSALALRAYGDPKQIETAITRAEAYMKDESRVAHNDDQEIAWAHAYRLLYFTKTGDKEMMARLVKKLAELQKRSGAWQHEYDNPFVTATILHVLEEAKGAGAEVPAAVLKRGAAALKSTRDAKGIFSYEFPGKGGAVEGAAGRMPFLEYALTLSGQAKPEGVKAALAESFRHHALLERVRKYDDHADAFHNGGFFFWYDQYGRALAAKAVDDAAALEKQREIVLSTSEIDGCWVDSHELGRVYGTAMALLTLKLCEKQ
ncbi:MAG TPA: hypothetical protein VNM14_21285 [Planctomycetota bacterium]|jgi:hypothetical protein|nr:hypothetical protein [Planctomycetota bacterium]